MSTAIRRSPVHVGTVVDARDLTPRMRRVRVRADALVGLAIRPAQDVELHLADAGGRRVKRRYTIRHLHADAGEIDLDVVIHGDGPGSTWGMQARPGDEVRFQGPRGKLEIGPADFHVLAGDETALPAIAAICESVSAPALAVIEIHDDAERQDIAAEVTWVPRDGRDPGTPDLLVPAVRQLAVPDGVGHGYLLGETRSMVALRTVLEDKGLDHDAIFVKGYWNIARPDRIAGRAPR